eukprot:6989274-Alexandrium_andersonii.AAC.1
MMFRRKDISSSTSSMFCWSSAGSTSDTPSSLGSGGPARGAPADAGPPWPATAPDASPIHRC